MAINFPSSPTVGQIVTNGGASYIWDGTKWKSLGVNVLARDQNLADLANAQTARVNMGLKWRTLATFQPSVATALFAFNIDADIGLVRIQGALACSAQNQPFFLRTSTNSGASQDTDYRISYSWITGNGTALLETAVENTAGYMYIIPAGDAVVPGSFQGILYPGVAGTVPTWTCNGVSLYMTVSQLRSWTTGARVVGTGRRNWGIILPATGNIQPGSFVIVEGAYA